MRSLMMGLLASTMLVISVQVDDALAFGDASGVPGYDEVVAAEPSWAVGIVTRVSLIPYQTEQKSLVTLFPYVYYDDADHIFYFRGLEGGLTFWKPGDWRFSAMGRLRFLDLPEEYHYLIQGDTFMGGLQARYSPFGPWHIDMEVLSDFNGHELANIRMSSIWQDPKMTLQAFFQAQYKTSEFNSYYFGLNSEEVNSGIELGVGASILYSVASNFFIFGRAETSLLDKPVRDVSFIDNEMTLQTYWGIGLKNDRTRTTPSVQKAPRYLRLAHGRVTGSSLSEVFSFNVEPDPDNHQMSSLFYGLPLSDTLLGLPINVFLHSGLGFHWANQKDTILEAILAVKFYYTIPLPVRLRIGFAEGWSWVSDIPYIENEEIREKGFEPSQLLNYLDFSADLNLGDIFGGKILKKTWLGYDIHHRSAIFEMASQFGSIKGGSNVQMLYLQYDF